MRIWETQYGKAKILAKNLILIRFNPVKIIIINVIANLKPQKMDLSAQKHIKTSEIVKCIMKYRYRQSIKIKVIKYK
jgi:hypothetical protein